MIGGEEGGNIEVGRVVTDDVGPLEIRLGD